MISSWGRLGAYPHETKVLSDRDTIAAQFVAGRPGLAFGNGRSYGDVALNPDGVLWITRGLDRFISFDENSGRLVCEAGILLRDIQRLSIPRGWDLAVTPGTQLVTVGGAIANDVHGKGQHREGSFGNHVQRITLLRTDGTRIHCGSNEQADWFAATVGSMGLTGIVVDAEIQLRRIPGPWLDVETIAYRGLDEFFQLADASEAEWEQTVAWIDCLSGAKRGLFSRGNFTTEVGSEKPQRSLPFPVVPPISLVNTLSLRAFNEVYYRLNAARSGRRLVHYASFLYPLDHIQDWNRMYGPRGFYQYQCVVPRLHRREAIGAILDVIAKSGEGSFLAVLKSFGDRQPIGMMSFPLPGVTLALDFPNNGQRTLDLFTRLDAIVSEAGGRLYAAKDARMPAAMFRSGYPRLAEFLPYRDKGVSSSLSRRLLGDP